MKKYEVLVWYRYHSFGELEKDFDVHNIEATDEQDAVNKASKLYPNFKRIPFQYLIENVKYKPQQFTNSDLFDLTKP